MRGIEIMEYLEYSKNNFLFPQEMKLFFFFENLLRVGQWNAY